MRIERLACASQFEPKPIKRLAFVIRRSSSMKLCARRSALPCEPVGAKNPRCLTRHEGWSSFQNPTSESRTRIRTSVAGAMARGIRYDLASDSCCENPLAAWRKIAASFTSPNAAMSGSAAFHKSSQTACPAPARDLVYNAGLGAWPPVWPSGMRHRSPVTGCKHPALGVADVSVVRERDENTAAD